MLPIMTRTRVAGKQHLWIQSYSVTCNWNNRCGICFMIYPNVLEYVIRMELTDALVAGGMHASFGRSTPMELTNSQPCDEDWRNDIS